MMPQSTPAGIIILKSLLTTIANSSIMMQFHFILYQIPAANNESKSITILPAAQLLGIQNKFRMQTHSRATAGLLLFSKLYLQEPI